MEIETEIDDENLKNVSSVELLPVEPVGFRETLKRVRKNLGLFEVLDIILTPLNVYLAIEFIRQPKCVVSSTDDGCYIEVSDLCDHFYIAVAINCIFCAANVFLNGYELWHFRYNEISSTLKIVHEVVVNYTTIAMQFVLFASWRSSELYSVVWFRLAIIFKNVSCSAWIICLFCYRVVIISESRLYNAALLLANIVPFAFVMVYAITDDYGCDFQYFCDVACGSYSTFDRVSCSNTFNGTCDFYH